MKSVALAFLLLSVNSVFAFDACTVQEAQILVRAASVEKIADGQCRVKFSWNDKWLYNSSALCPLDAGDVGEYGVIVDCGVKVGDTVSGVVYRSVDGNRSEIYLEK